jgi:cobalt-zinc-cadmium efflux system membrane fusion protein
MSKTQLSPIIIVILIGIILGGLILTWDTTTSPTITDAPVENAIKAATTKNTSGRKEENIRSVYTKGSRGGKLFTTDGFSVEVTIYEKGVPPQFRLYLYENGKPLSPAEVKVNITLTRLGAPAQLFRFTPEGNYLIGDQVVKEPHSFDVTITAERNGKTIHWNYAQVEGRVSMPDVILKNTGIEIITAGQATIKPTLTLPGEIIFNHHTLVQVVPRMPGMVTSVTRHVGQQVKKGEILAVIESPMLAELRSQYMIAQKRLTLAQTTFEREKRLWEEKITAKQDYLSAQEIWSESETRLHLALVKLRSLRVQPESNYSGQNLARFEILAPISGLIISKGLALGETLKEDQKIFTIADVSTVWTAITAYPKDLNIVKVGQKAVVEATASNVVGKGEINYISTLIGEQTRTATVRIELDNKDGRWRPGMFVNAELVTEEIQVPVAVSMDAIQTMSNRSVVFGRYGEYFEIRPLKLGRNDGKMAEVLNGLSAGEKYAVGNSFAIKAELGKDSASHDN